MKSSLSVVLLVVNLIVLAIGVGIIAPQKRQYAPLREVDAERITVLTPEAGRNALADGQGIPRENLQALEESGSQSGNGADLPEGNVELEGEHGVSRDAFKDLHTNVALKGLPSLSEVTREPPADGPIVDMQRQVEAVAKELRQQQEQVSKTVDTDEEGKPEMEITSKVAVVETEHSEQCVRLGPFNDQWFGRLLTALGTDDIRYLTERKLEQVLPLYRVYMGPFLTTVELNRTKRTLSENAATVDYYVFKDSENEMPYVSFGVFSSKQRARDYSEKLSAMGVDVSARQEGEKVVAGHWVVLTRGDYRTHIAPKLKKVRYRVLESDCFSVKR